MNLLSESVSPSKLRVCFAATLEENRRFLFSNTLSHFPFDAWWFQVQGWFGSEKLLCGFALPSNPYPWAFAMGCRVLDAFATASRINTNPHPGCPSWHPRRCAPPTGRNKWMPKRPLKRRRNTALFERTVPYSVSKDMRVKHTEIRNAAHTISLSITSQSCHYIQAYPL